MRQQHQVALLAFCSASLVAGACNGVGRAPNSGAASGMVWEATLDNAGAAGWFGVPALYGGTLYLAEGPNITALDADDGHRIWSTRVRQYVAPVTEKILANESQIFFPDAPDVISLDRATGNVVWKFTPDEQATASLSALDPKAMYTGTRSHRVYALDIHDGHPLWVTDVGKDWEHLGIVAGITLSGDTLYAAVVRYLAHNGYLRSAVIVALDKNDGHELWRYESSGNRHEITTSPVVSGGYLVGVDALFNSFFAIDRFTGKEVWRVEGEPGAFGPQDDPVISGDTAFVASADQYVYAISVSTGKVFWRSKGGGSFSAGVACGSHVFGNALGIDVFDRASGRNTGQLLTGEARTSSIPTSRFVTDGRKIYIAGSHAAVAIKC